MTWRDQPDEYSTMHGVGEGLGALTRKLGLSSPRTFATLADEWPEVVGAQLAAHSVPVTLQERTLLVEVDDPRWATQLKWLAGQLASKANQVVDADVVDKIEVRVRRGR